MTATNGAPTGLDAYWDGIDEELARYPAAPELHHLPLRSSDDYTVYWVKLTSIGPYRIGGYFSVPTGEGPFPALMQAPRYGSVNHVPDRNDRLRYVVLTLMHRGQRLADQPFAAAFPGLLTQGIESPNTYVYRGILADCLRGAEFLLSRPEVDKRRVAISGDDKAMITAARRPDFAVAQISGLLFHRLMEARESSEAYPIEEVNDYLRTFPDQTNAVANTLAHFDPIHHANGIQARTLLSVGDSGSVGGPEWLKALISTINGEVETYEITHAGGTDNDSIDAWLAGQLGREPMSRFRKVLA
jgi:cephalosporin-C deacetylase